MPLRILHTNDTHGTLLGQQLSQLEKFRSQVDLYFDSGDTIRAGNLGIPLKPEPAWAALDQLRCTASVMGNRESHPLEAAFKAKMAGTKHPILCANMRRKDGTYPLPRSIIVQSGGYRVGVLGVMVPIVTEKMVTRSASAFLWDPPIEVATQIAEELRPQCDLLIALTHIGVRQDRELADRCPLIDLILGGHSHTILQTPEYRNRTWICQGGAHSKFAGVYEWEPSNNIAGGLQMLTSDL